MTTSTARPRPPPSRRRRPGGGGPVRTQRRLAWLLCAPAVLVMVAVTVLPLGYGVWLSLLRYDLRFPGQREFVGLRNYAAVFSSPVFWQDLGATALIAGISVLAELVLGLGIAVVLHRSLVGRRTVRTAVLLPYGIITVVAAFSWQYAFTPGLSFFSDRPWLSERWSSFFVIVVTEVWQATPFVSLLLLAGLAAMPEEMLEAARVDGATTWQRLTSVALPALRPVLVVAALYRSVDAVRVFDPVFIQTGGANGTETLSLLAYDQLVDRLNLGLGSAVSVVLFALAAGIAAAFLLGFRSDLRQASAGSP